MTTLALDLGTTTGFAWKAANGVIVTGTWNFKPSRYEGGGMRYLKFKDKLEQMHTQHPYSVVYFEEVRAHKGVDAAHVYGGLLATLTSWCEWAKIPYQGVPVGAIKKSWTGKGNADKAMMIAKAEELGFTVIDDNEADAIALLYLVTGNE